MPTDTGVSVPSGWKLQDTEVCVPVVLVDLNLHDSFPWVPFATKISFGVYTSKAATPAVTGEGDKDGLDGIRREYPGQVHQKRQGRDSGKSRERAPCLPRGTRLPAKYSAARFFHRQDKQQSLGFSFLFFSKKIILLVPLYLTLKFPFELIDYCLEQF